MFDRNGSQAPSYPEHSAEADDNISDLVVSDLNAIVMSDLRDQVLDPATLGAIPIDQTCALQ